jgi:MFS family permease
MYGFDSTIVGSVIGLPSFHLYFNFEYASSCGSSIIDGNNGVCAGGGIGCWIANWLSDKFDRRLAIQIISAALPAGSDLVADGEAGTAHQAGQVKVDCLVARRFRVGRGVGS